MTLPRGPSRKARFHSVFVGRASPRGVSVFLGLLLALSGPPRPAAGQVEEAWRSLYDGPAGSHDRPCAMAVDGEGNVVVAGTSEFEDGHSEYATVKYDPSGRTMWIARYDGKLGYGTQTGALALGANGEVHVAGSAGTVKYSPEGRELWVAPRTGCARAVGVAVDRAGNIHVLAECGFDFVTAKYDPEGRRLWEARYDGPAADEDYPVAIALDPAGNVYVTGNSYDVHYIFEYATLKYDPDGALLWEARYHSPRPDGHVEVRGLAVDGRGSVHVAGYSQNALPSVTGDYTTLKYWPDGALLWEARHGGPRGWDDYASAMALDADGNVYVTGTVESAFATVKYDATGKLLWVARNDHGPGGEGAASAIALDGAGGVYVTGESFQGAIVTDRYDATGTLLWSIRSSGDEGLATPHALAVDRLGDVLVAAESRCGGVSCDFITIEYRPVAVKGRFIRGDANADGRLELDDALGILQAVFRDRPPDLRCDRSLDSNDDGRLDITDAIHLLWHLFLDGPAPAPPSGGCGPDPTPDALTCESFPACG